MDTFEPVPYRDVAIDRGMGGSIEDRDGRVEL